MYRVIPGFPDIAAIVVLWELPATPVIPDLALAAIVATQVIPESLDIVATPDQEFPVTPVIRELELAVTVAIVATPASAVIPAILVSRAIPAIVAIRVTPGAEQAGTPGIPATLVTPAIPTVSSVD